MDRLRTFLSGRMSLIFMVTLSLALGASLAMNLCGRDPIYAAGEKPAQRAALYDLQEAFTSVVEEVVPSVVSIVSERTDESPYGPSFEEFLKDFPFPFPSPGPNDQPTKSYGSGVIVRSDGYILTNDHVVGGADKVTVKLKDGREYEGTVSRDPRGDLALIKIDATALPAAKLGDSSKVKVGSWAIAIGSPFELDQTVTVGVVSATGRHAAMPERSSYYSNLIQTDASINPGNSGGPLVNLDGEVIGVNTLITSPSRAGGNIGIGFAIPSNTAKFVMEQLIAHGKVTRGFLGIEPVDLTPKTAEQYGVKEGAFVKGVEVGKPADKAGVQVEDVIVEIDGKKITNEIRLREVVAAIPPGTTVDVVVVRNKARKTLRVTLGEAPVLQAAKSPQKTDSKLGFSVEDITPDIAREYKLPDDAEGVVVTQVLSRSEAAQAGLRPGHLIIRANNKKVTSVAEFDAATKDLKSGDTLRLVVRAENFTTLVEFTID